MATELRRPVRPTTPADLHRLAAQGEAKGVQLFQAQATGAWFATSISHPGELHALTGYSCGGVCRARRSRTRSSKPKGRPRVYGSSVRRSRP